MRKSVRAIPVDVLEIDNDGHVLARVVECLLLNSEQPNGALEIKALRSIPGA